MKKIATIIAAIMIAMAIATAAQATMQGTYDYNIVNSCMTRAFNTGDMGFQQRAINYMINMSIRRLVDMYMVASNSTDQHSELIMQMADQIYIERTK